MRTHLGERAHPSAALIALAALLFTAGCDDGTDAGAQRTPEPEPAAAERRAPSALALHMTGRYARATDLRDAIVRGDLRSANAVARELAQPVRLERLPPEATSHVVGVHVRAQEVAEATSLLDASAAFAALARSCGECHAAAGVQPSAPLPPVPAPDSREGGPMRRHQEAVQGMWEGLLFGSTERFDAGARILANAPLTKPEQQGNAEIRRLADEARAYARTATRSEGLAGRSEQFGLLLTRCSECHATARGAER